MTPLPPLTFTIKTLMQYLQLNSRQAVYRWLQSHRVRAFVDNLGYTRVFRKDVDAVMLQAAADTNAMIAAATRDER